MPLSRLSPSVTTYEQELQGADGYLYQLGDGLNA